MVKDGWVNKSKLDLPAQKVREDLAPQLPLTVCFSKGSLNHEGLGEKLSGDGCTHSRG